LLFLLGLLTFQFWVYNFIASHTHSPALIMNGWIDAVTEVSDITTH
jgi:hypothetical protein